MATLVTGSSGYIGQHVILELLDRGEDPIGLDWHDKPDFNIKYISYVGDINDRIALRHIFKDHRIDTVMHLAAVANVPDSVINPMFYYDDNVARTIILLDEMIKSGVKNIIFSSSAAIFGDSEEQPIHEYVTSSPTTPYGKTKLFIEEILTDLHLAGKLNFVSLRYFCAAGADSKLRAGEDFNKTSHVIPMLINRAYDGGIFEIYGDDHNTLDGSCIRDFIHVSDIACAHIAAKQYLEELSGLSLVKNIGSGVGYSIKQLLKLTQDVIGRNILSQVVESRVGDPAVLVADSCEELPGYSPKYTVEDMIKSTWEWKIKYDHLTNTTEN